VSCALFCSAVSCPEGSGVVSCACAACVRLFSLSLLPPHLDQVARAYGAGNRVVRWCLVGKTIYFIYSISLCCVWGGVNNNTLHAAGKL
jgi:hypothetical protein